MQPRARRVSKAIRNAVTQSFGVDAFGDGPTDDATRIEVQNRSQVHEAGSNPNVSDIGHPDLIDSAHLAVLGEIGIDRQSVAGIGRPHKRAPRDWPQPELFHHATYAFLIHFLATAFQLRRYPPITVARKFFVNAFDLLTQLLVLIVTTLLMLFVGFVVERAGG